jgi:hypothetical protein
MGGLILLGAFLKSAIDMFAPDYGATSLGGVGGVFLMGVGSLLLGVVLMVIYNVVAPAYFSGRILNEATPVLVAEDGLPTTFGMPDAPSHERLVIPPDDEPAARP